MSFDRNTICVKFAAILTKANASMLRLLDEEFKPELAKEARENKVDELVIKDMERDLMMLEPARLDIYKYDGSFNRVLDSPNGLWIMAVPLERFHPQGSAHQSLHLPGEQLSALIAVELKEGKARFSDILCAVIYSHCEWETEERAVLLTPGEAKHPSGKPFLPCLVAEDEDPEFWLDEEWRKNMGGITSIYSVVVCGQKQSLRGRFNAAEAALGCALFQAVGGEAWDVDRQNLEKRLLISMQVLELKLPDA